MLSKIQIKINKNAQVLASEFANEGNEDVISKKGFMKVLKEKAKLSDKEIEQCLAESSVVSMDIAHIRH